MEKNKKFRVVVFANGFKHVRYSDDKSELINYSDNIISICRCFHLSFTSRLYAWDVELGYYTFCYSRDECFKD